MGRTLRRLRDKAWPVALGLALVAGCVWATQTHYGPVRAAVDGAENFVYDQRLILTRPAAPEPDDRVFIIDIDERSLGEVGRWPWPRAIVADLVDALWDAGVVVIGFDVVFAEAERNIVERIREAVDHDPALDERLAALEPDFDGDTRLAESLAFGDSVLGYILHTDDSEAHTGVLPPPNRDDLTGDADRPLAVHRLPNFTGNRSELQEAAQAGGFFTVRPDGDGVVRRAPLVLGHEDQLYASLALETVRLYQLLDGFDLETARIGGNEAVEAVQLGGDRFPTDGRGQVLVPYLGPAGTFPYISAVDVLRGEAPNALEGSIVLIGTSAMGLFDLRATPTDSVFPGVEIHANLVSAMLDGSFPYRPSWADGADLLTLVGIGVLLALTMPFLSPWVTLATAAVTVAALTGWNFWLWSSHELVLSYAPGVTAVALITVLNLGWGFLFEHRRRNALRRRFGEYVPPQLVDRMAEQPEAYGFQGENREITILFADIRGFTTLSEALEADALKNLLNRFFTPMTRIIFDRQGTIDKYVGDMIMAFWGAPVDDPEHRRHAVQAALDMLDEVDTLRDVFTAEGLPAIDIGVGLNSGSASVGDMGSEYRRAYTALGDSVNLASRCEAATKSYGVRFMVTEHTREGLEDAFLFRELDRIRVKGRSEPVTMYEPIGPIESVSDAQRDRVARHHGALERFRARDWDGAEAAFRALQEAHGDDACVALYLERIETLRTDDPGEGWDGVFTRKEK